MVLVVPSSHFKKVQTLVDRAGEKVYTIGKVIKGEHKVTYS
jgi:phosphoribosylaminoimidazole (AIR) synthetase